MSNECDIIYECKACRNIFRSLANFISHKRVYCKNKFNATHHFHFRPDNNSIDQDLSTIIQKDQDYRNNVTTVTSANNKNSTKDLSSIIDRLLRKDQVTRSHTLSDYYESAAQSVAHQKEDQKTHLLQLDKVNSEDLKCIAVYQTVVEDVKPNDIVCAVPGNSIKEEVLEVHSIQMDNTVTLGTDGKIVPNKIANDVTSKFSSVNLPKKHSCQLCK